MLHPSNKDLPFPLILTGPASSKNYFEKIDLFLKKILGKDIQKHYKIIIDNPEQVAKEIATGIQQKKKSEACFTFNWQLFIDPSLQKPFITTHENMASLDLHLDQEPCQLAANLRRAFSGIVAGNIDDRIMSSIKQNGLFKINGDGQLMDALDDLLKSFADQNRMNLHQKRYTPCYQILK